MVIQIWKKNLDHVTMGVNEIKYQGYLEIVELNHDQNERTRVIKYRKAGSMR